MYKNKNPNVLKAMEEVRETVNPFYDIPTSAIREVDPDFTWPKR